MGQINLKYPVFEIAISCEHGGTHTGGLKERKRVGDIIAIRRPGVNETGSGAAGRVIWMPVEGLEENEMARLTDSIDGHDKRRYCIPFARLKQIVPTFDIDRALDVNDKYSPFFPLDLDGRHFFLTSSRPLNVRGLIFDKVKGDFI